MPTFSQRVKRAVASVAVHPVARPIFLPFARHRLTVFMLHRFADPSIGTPGAEPEHLRAVLRMLRRERIPICSLREAVSRLLAGFPVEGVAFTVDDGYLDFEEVGAPLFREFDAPVTVFLASGFLDGAYWFWWDKIIYAVERTTVPALSVPGFDRAPFSFRTPAERDATVAALVEWVKAVPQEQRAERIRTILTALDTPIPDEAPARFQPMSWAQVRRCAAEGVEFGPHTVNHVSVGSSRTEQIRTEVRASYARLCQELPSALPIFCFPFGGASDVSKKAAMIVAAEGMVAAFTALPGYVGPDSAHEPCLLPRFAFPSTMVDTLQVVHGIERFKAIVRSRARIPR